mmetsp:Transcript_9380/g.18471  ORF Transcript_9380/g.18471 Transcript_9380/m.18471 type:complete len:444 (-) Transcript_9380:308-1639(-)
MEDWSLVTLPSDHDGVDGIFRKLSSVVVDPGIASAFQLETPELKVGTLDSLMSLSDELGKHDSAIETVLRKIERQYQDMAGSATSFLAVGSTPPNQYLAKFTWDLAKYSRRRTLPELVSLILSGVGSVDDELKQLTVNLTEATQRLTSLTRKKGGNLTSAPLDEVLKPEMVQGFIDSEYLRTVCVVVPKSMEAEFLSSYHAIGDQIAGYGGPDWRNQRGCGEPDSNYGPFCDRKGSTGSPVVPGSATRLIAEGEHILFSLVVLKGQYEAGYIDGDQTYQQGNYIDFMDAFKVSAREKRVIVRDYKATKKSGDSKNEIADLEILVAEKQAGLERWCRTHYGEVFSAWIHLKVIRAFVESVLRYGVHAGDNDDSRSRGERHEQSTYFMLAAVKVNKSKGPLLKAALDGLMHIGSAATSLAADDAEEGEYHPYCKLEFTLASQSSS